MEPQHPPTEVHVHGESKPQKVMSVWAAIVIGLSIIIATAIVVAGIIFIRGMDALEDVEQIDVQVNDEPRTNSGSFNMKIN